MKNEKRDLRESDRKLVDCGYQSKSIRYNTSHERFVVPWQMEQDNRKDITVS